MIYTKDLIYPQLSETHFVSREIHIGIAAMTAYLSILFVYWKTAFLTS